MVGLTKEIFISRVIYMNESIKLFQLLLIVTFAINLPVHIIEAQTISVRGTVTSSTGGVLNAAVTFVDNSDTTKKFSTLTDASGYYSLNLLTSVEQANTIPSEFELDQNYPNPFLSSTAISYKLNKQADVQLTIYDILGREVRKFTAGNKNVGVHGIQWDAKNNYGQKLSAGVYLYQMCVGNKTLTKKMILGTNLSSNINIAQLSSVNNMLSKSALSSISSGVYHVRIENGARTNPQIISKRIDNVLIAKDTTINISVEKPIPVATININSTQQVIRGFGASNVLLWRPDMTGSEVETAFGTNNGQIGFSILRIMAEADSNRWSLYLASAKKAQGLGATIIASPWFAPADMVESVVEAGKTRSRVRFDMYDKYAAHLNAFIKYMKKNGVTIYGLSVQNEPDITETWTSWSTTEMFSFMKSYAHLLEGTKVMAPESFQFRRNMSDPILNDSVACANTDIVCGHIYGAGLASYPLAKSKGKEVWMTEYLFGEQNSANNWSWAIKVATNINEVMKADMSAYVWWNIVRYYGPIGDGEKATQNPNESYPKKGEVTKKGYVMSQFSKFIRPGYFRIESSITPAIVGIGVDVTAYKDPVTSKVVIVAVNTSSNSIKHEFKIQNGATINSFTPHTTSESKNCLKGESFPVANGMFTITLEPSSITTFVAD